jgi:uncharacterized spore protein YtfJ
MENINFLENLAARLGASSNYKNVYGEPVIAGDKTIIPVQKLCMVLAVVMVTEKNQRNF